ncbi:FUSC family protein [Oscillibacter sp.]|uniref:FUSC family protein n=1 Tax=Oscillibacter sp. TaxID=1945593 RepID=UPI00260D8243|nr:FUSC family protein [Oscillibacter sp.]
MTKEKICAVGKGIAGKLPVFLFCVLFINGYNTWFGKENSIVGVILLMGLLMFLKADFGIDAKYSAVLVPLLFVSMGLCAKLSAWNPLVGLVVDAVFLSAALLFTRLDATHSAYLPFFMGFLMLRGYDVTGELFVKRMVSLAVIGYVVGLLHFLGSRKTCGHAQPSALLRGLSLYGPWERWALSLTVTLLVTLLFGDLLSIPKSMWVNLTVLSLMMPIEDDLVRRRRLRIPATILGCVLFIALFGWLIPPDYQTAALLLAGFLSMFITSYFIKTVYNSFSALVTATLLLPAKAAVLTRIGNNLIGAAVALLSLFLFNRIFLRLDQRRQNAA